MKLTDQQAHELVHKELLKVYTEADIKDMPYKVFVDGDRVVSWALNGEWFDTYKIELTVKVTMI